MNVKLAYHAQVRMAAGTGSETVSLPEGASLAAALAEITRIHGAEMEAILVDEAGTVRPSILILLDGIPITRGTSPILRDGCVLSIFSAVAGG